MATATVLVTETVTKIIPVKTSSESIREVLCISTEEGHYCQLSIPKTVKNGSRELRIIDVIEEDHVIDFGLCATLKTIEFANLTKDEFMEHTKDATGSYYDSSQLAEDDLDDDSSDFDYDFDEDDDCDADDDWDEDDDWDAWDGDDDIDDDDDVWEDDDEEDNCEFV